jgi:hypothetical protein
MAETFPMRTEQQLIAIVDVAAMLSDLLKPSGPPPYIPQPLRISQQLHKERVSAQ